MTTNELGGLIFGCIILVLVIWFLYWNRSVPRQDMSVYLQGPDWSEYCAVTPTLCGLCESPDVTDSHVQDPGLLPLCLDCEEEIFNDA